MGRIGAPFGVRGWVKVEPYTERRASILDYSRWWLGPTAGPGAWREVRIEDGAARGAAVVVKLADCGSREDAAGLQGLEVAVRRSALPSLGDGEYYWADLIGLDVVNMQGIGFGRVTGVLRTGANDVLVVRGGSGPERLIPFIAAAIRGVDFAARAVSVDWHEDW